MAGAFPTMASRELRQGSTRWGGIQAVPTAPPRARRAALPSDGLVSWWFKTPYLELDSVLPSRRLTEYRQTGGTLDAGVAQRRQAPTGDRLSPVCPAKLCAQQPVDQTARPTAGPRSRPGSRRPLPAPRRPNPDSAHHPHPVGRAPPDPAYGTGIRQRAAGRGQPGSGHEGVAGRNAEPDPAAGCPPPVPRIRAPDASGPQPAAPALRPAPGALLGCGQSPR